MKNEWIECKGGECPVPKGTLVDVKYRDGDLGIAKEAGKYGAGIGPSAAVYWSHSDNGGDIIAWRLHQTEQAAWDGEGLPPAGCECEVYNRGYWFIVKIKYVGEVYVIAEDSHNGKEYAYELANSPDRFRPIRTEAEHKREKAIKAMIDCSAVLLQPTADLIYDAIAAGEIPGVKIE